MNNENPLVSIIVRTKDRPKLVKNALRSIALQSYRPLEIILVNDGGCDLPLEDLKCLLPDVALQYMRLEKNTGRAHAGNVGIEHAQGYYIGFLDDDDEFHPEHIKTLVTSLQGSEYDIAYTGVEFIEKSFHDDGSSSHPEKKTIFARDFSYEDLIINNYIPLMSLLFKADLLKDLEFDESFDLYEDWDMLIRAGVRTKFHFINKITAIYNQWSNFQIAFKSPQEIIRKETLKLYKKHCEKMPLERIFDLREENARKDNVIAVKDEYIGNIENRLHDIEKALEEKETYIHAIHSSRGWRLLSKYYKIRDRILRHIR
jgi:glycosyltransferase involved in cell wall biosynthesis